VAKSVVIVESPAKARTIGKFLGPGYRVESCMGHVRDLPKKTFGVNIEDGFRPAYRLLPDRRQVVARLKKAAAGAPAVYLATDPDREGEAIAWHLLKALGSGGLARLRRAARAGHEPGQRPAGAAHPRPHHGLPAIAVAQPQGRQGAERGEGPVRRRAPDRRARERDSGLRAEGVLGDNGHPRARGARGDLQGQTQSVGGPEAGNPRRGDGQGGGREAGRGAVRGGRGDDQAEPLEPPAAVRHQPTPASGLGEAGLPSQKDDAGGSATLRGGGDRRGGVGGADPSTFRRSRGSIVRGAGHRRPTRPSARPRWNGRPRGSRPT